MHVFVYMLHYECECVCECGCVCMPFCEYEYVCVCLNIYICMSYLGHDTRQCSIQVFRNRLITWLITWGSTNSRTPCSSTIGSFKHASCVLRFKHQNCCCYNFSVEDAKFSQILHFALKQMFFLGGYDIDKVKYCLQHAVFCITLGPSPHVGGITLQPNS